MKLCDYADNIFLGYNRSAVNQNTVNPRAHEYKLLTISSMRSGFIYIKEINDNEKYASNVEIDPKYFTKKDDIIICCKQPYNMVLIKQDEEKNILIPSNFVVIRDSNIDVNYLYNYLRIKLNEFLKYKRENSKVEKQSDNISKADVEDIEINVPKTSTIKLSTVLKRINNRQSLYNNLINNDEELIKTLLRKEGVIEND